MNKNPSIHPPLTLSVTSHDTTYDLYDLLEEDALTRLRDADCMSASDTDNDSN